MAGVGSNGMNDDQAGQQMSEADSSSIALFFDKMSAERNELFRAHPGLGYEQEVRSRAVLDAVDVRAGESILDIGCGNARDILPMLENGATIVGVDLSEGMLEQARRDLAAAGHDDVRLELGDATQLAFSSGAFDKIVCSETIEHIPDAEKAVSEMYRVLKPGGALVISTPNRHSWYGFDRYVVSSGLLSGTIPTTTGRRCANSVRCSLGTVSKCHIEPASVSFQASCCLTSSLQERLSTCWCGS